MFKKITEYWIFLEIKPHRIRVPFDLLSDYKTDKFTDDCVHLSTDSNAITSHISCSKFQ